MKEIMLPYVFIIWLLVKLGVITWNLRNATTSVGIGLLLMFALFTGHRFWSPVDLTDSSTIKAPHAVMSPLVGHQIKDIYVSHNQKVKKGDLLYSLETVEINEEIKSLEAKLVSTEHKALAIEKQIEMDERNYQRLLNLNKFSSDIDREELRALIEKETANLLATRSEVKSIQATINQKRWISDSSEVHAPFDGEVGIINIAKGSHTGNLHLFDTSKKFLEMRVSDQTFRYIKKGQFAEFYVDSHPGETFRGRVHSMTRNTGEAVISVRGAPQRVNQHVQNNAGTHGRTVVIEFTEPEGYDIPLGATGSGWISATKPHKFLGFMDIIGGATVRLKAMKAYLSAL